MATGAAGHYAIQTPRSEGPSVPSLNEDDISFGSAEASWVSPSKLKQQQQPTLKAGNFISRLTKPTGSTPLAEIKNIPLPLHKTEFTPLLKSVAKNQLMKRAFVQTPSKLRHGFGKSASTSDLPGLAAAQDGSAEFSILPDDDASAIQNENDLVEMSKASVSGITLPSRSPGSADGAALLTLREQEKVLLKSGPVKIGHR